MKCLKRTKDCDSEDKVPKDNMNDICESDIDMEKDEISFGMSCNIVEKSLELFDYLPLENVRSGRTLQTGKRKVNSVTSAFTKTNVIASDEPVLE